MNRDQAVWAELATVIGRDFVTLEILSTSIQRLARDKSRFRPVLSNPGTGLISL
ncbi:hypothetical protein VTK73DRAFT_3852 [Phialemonium thermophilum]|uniref:Uncharacterized protein n=1 Tax=Phialemonium thermophilum TaxID=223376 RepID=A0ABR3WWJ9_9PEZI